MSRRNTVGLAVVVVGIAAGIFSVASSASSQGGHGTVRLFEHDTSQASIDLGSKGPSPGDEFVFAGDVFDHKGGTKLGRLAGYCTTVSKTEVQCTVSTTLAGGELSSQGLFLSAQLFGGKTLSFPITGGTGIYRDARGYGTVQVPPNVPHETDANFVLYLG
jgi:hypothetical protein